MDLYGRCAIGEGSEKIASSSLWPSSQNIHRHDTIDLVNGIYTVFLHQAQRFWSNLVSGI